MKIVNWIFGIFALGLLMLFLGKYAVSIGSLPLWVIIVGVFLLPVLDVIKSLKEDKGTDEQSESGGG